MAAEATLTYTKTRGLVEIARLIMAYTGVEFTENNLKSREDFVQLVDSGRLPFQQVPLLEIDGLELVQSATIARYLARRGGIYGSSAAEQAKIDMYYDGSRDFAMPLRGVGLFDSAMPNCEKVRDRYLPAFEKLLASSETGYLVGSSLTLADLGLLEALLMLEETFGSDVLDAFPSLQKFYAMMKSEPKLAAYLNGPQRNPPFSPESAALVRKIFNL